MAKKVEYIKSAEGIGAPKPKRARSIHADAQDWIRDNPSEFKRWAGKYAAITGTGVVLVGDSEEEVWTKIKKKPNEYPQNPLVLFVPGLNKA